MKIECKNKREGGSTIDIGGIAYEFKPQADGAHVADIGNKEHIERFLSIPEAYGIYTAGKAAKEEPVAAPVAEEGPHVDSGVDATETPEGTEAPASEAGDDLASLKEAFKAKFGHAAHHKWTAEVIKSKLAE